MAEQAAITIHKVTKKDVPWITEVFQTQWSGNFIVSRGKKYFPQDLDGFIAHRKEEKVGLLTFRNDGDTIELSSLDSFCENQGIGTALITALITYARDRNKRRVWVITTNNNAHAIRFYEHRGFKKVRVYKNAIVESRKIKPSIPLVDEHNVPIRDEIEFEYQIRDKNA